MSVDVSAVYKSTIEHFKQAQKNIAIEKRMFEHSADAISDVSQDLKLISSNSVHTTKRIMQFFSLI